MLSRTQVINNGLRIIGANLIADPDEDTESARQAKGVYEQTVLAELESHAWSFAKAQAVLPQSAVNPLFGFQRAFTIPSDFVKLVELENRWAFYSVRNIDTNPMPAFEVQGRSILTNFDAPLRISYLRDLSGDPTLWPPLFAETVSAALAGALAMTLTKSQGVVETAEKLYRKATRRATQSNAIQKPPAHIPDGSWITARLY
jgi:hypothetical protein